MDFFPTISDNPVKVTKETGTLSPAYTVDFPTIQGVSQYFIFARPVPLFRDIPIKTVSSPPVVVETDDSGKILFPLYFPEDLTIYFWVGYRIGGNLQLISTEGATIHDDQFNPPIQTSPEFDEVIDTDYMSEILGEIRRRHIAMLQNDAEEFIWFKRRWVGVPCKTSLNNPFRPSDTPDVYSHPSFDDHSRDEICFGTGIVGGYYPGIKILLRYGETPIKTIRFKDLGIELTHDFNSWTLWHPRLQKLDLLLRTKTGEYFVIDECAESKWRNVILHQKIKLTNLQETDIRQKVSDETIQAAESTVDVTSRFYSRLWY